MKQNLGCISEFILAVLLVLPLTTLNPSALAAEAFVKNAEERARIEAAIPDRAPASPTQPRRLLIFTRNVGYGGHPSILHANEAFTLMGRKTGAFEAVVSDDPAVFSRESLRGFDAVFFNNTVGNCFTNADLRQNLLEFVTGGGGLMGLHGTSVGFTRWPGALEDWPEFGLMIGARGAAHKASDEKVWIKPDDSAHPLVRMFPAEGFEYRDEFFRFGAPYSRERVRVLLSIDTTRTDLASGPQRGDVTRPDNDYALAWIRNYGRGRIFYSTIGHNPHVFWDPRMLHFYLGAAQFVLGDVAAHATPSAKLTDAVRRQEAMGWRLGIEAYTFHKFTFFETIEKTAQLGLAWIGGLSFQKVGGGIDKNFEPKLSDDELSQIRMKLDAAGLRLLAYYIHDIPNDEKECRAIFEFGKKMGIETFLAEPKAEALALIDRFCQAYGIKVALHNHDQKASPQYWNPEGILKACAGRSQYIGACGDLGYWMRSGIDPVQAIRTLGGRLMTLQIHDLDSLDANGQDVPWGTGSGKTTQFFRELHRSGIKPVMLGLEYSRDWLESLPKIQQSIEFFNATAATLHGGPRISTVDER